jgi:hypothetical protein
MIEEYDCMSTFPIYMPVTLDRVYTKPTKSREAI